MLKRFTLGFAAAIVAVLAAPALAQTKDKVVLLLNWYTYSEHAPFYLGKERGYFEQEGIDLDIQEGRGSGVTVQAVAAGTATFGYADVATMMKAASKGAPVTAVGVALQTAPMPVVGFADKNIRKPEDIKARSLLSPRVIPCRRSGRCSRRKPDSRKPISGKSPATHRRR